jgi:beta-N-acetylhexosaminidase
LLRLFGFNLDLCPVLDISYDDEADNSLRGRCYGSSVEETLTNAEIFRAAMATEGILSCGKHFPGYTYAGLDPHHELPCIERSRAELEACELAVFRYFSNKVDSMMIGHAHYPCFEPDAAVPASLSPAVIRDCLIDELGFRGLVMTDDLDMGAILNTFDWHDTIRRAVHAGNHLIMICHRLEAAEDALRVLEAMPADDLAPAHAALSAFKQRLAPPAEFSEEAHRLLDEQVWQLRTATLGEELARTRSEEDGKRSPVEIY